MKRIQFLLILLISLKGYSQNAGSKVYAGADQTTPSLAQYESWINNTNEGSTESQTLSNLDFFRWLKDEYGMMLDIYAISAGAIDKAQWYGSMESEDFKRQFPNGFGPIFNKASKIGTQLGTWGGPDGFGNTPEEEKARIEMMVKLCRDFKFRLLKFDAVVGQLRNDKQDAFIRMMTECRKYSPDLILNNHRLNLNEEAKKHVTTTLWGGVETYVDVHISNYGITAPHHRGGNLSRDIVPGFERLIEDHGVCLSSCLDYWEDDLVLQAFNRTLILSPHIYGNPWFLRDDEYPKLARIFNIARKYGKILVNGIVLPEEKYGEKAISRGNSNTRLITLRNISWNKSEATITIGAETGLTENIKYEARLLHPVERVLGNFRKGETFKLDVDPFRSALVLICPEGEAGIGIEGCDYEVVSNVPGKPVKIILKGLSGTRHEINLKSDKIKFSRAEIDHSLSPEILRNKKTEVTFPGEPLKEQWHRKIADLIPCNVPEDAEALYEATVFSADNNALEIRSLTRSGETKIPEVKAAREAFLNQPLFAERGLWDRYMFDGDPTTSFFVCRRFNSTDLINGGSLRIDFGKPVSLDELNIEVGSEHALQPWKTNEAISLQVSANLKDWSEIKILIDKTLKVKLNPQQPIRYVRFNGTPDKITEIKGFLNGVPLDRKEWRGSNLFSSYRRIGVEKSWSASTVLNEIPTGSYLAVCLNGEHGIEGAYAAVRVDGKPVGASDRSPSYPTNPWERYVIKSESNYTYYIPLTADMEGKKIDIVVLGMKGGKSSFKPEAWLTCYPVPYIQKELILYR